MIMGNSFNCLPIIDYLGERALELESRIWTLGSMLA